MSAVTDILLAPDVRPFAVAAAIMATLGGIEVLTMIVGFSISQLVSTDFAIEGEHDGVIGGLFLWINAGRLPLLILIILALGVFAIEGFSCKVSPTSQAPPFPSPSPRWPPSPSACR